MKLWAISLCLLAACGGAHAATAVWQPAAGNSQIPIWPGAAPDAQPVPGPETAKVSDKLLAGKPVTAVTHVTRPTMTVYAPKGKNTGAAVVVFPEKGEKGVRDNFGVAEEVVKLSPDTIFGEDPNVSMAAMEFAHRYVPTIFRTSVEAISPSTRNAVPQVGQVENAKSA